MTADGFTVDDLLDEIERVEAARYVRPDEMRVAHFIEMASERGVDVPYRTALDNVRRAAKRHGFESREALTSDNMKCVAFSKAGLTRADMAEIVFDELATEIEPGEVTAAQVAERLGVHLDTAKARLAALVEKGELEENWRKGQNNHVMKAWRPAARS